MCGRIISCHGPYQLRETLCTIAGKPKTYAPVASIKTLDTFACGSMATLKNMEAEYNAYFKVRLNGAQWIPRVPDMRHRSKTHAKKETIR